MCRVEGVVTDMQKEPLPGAHVMVESAKVGAATDADGHYTLYLAPGRDYTLKVSFVGMKSQYAKVSLK